CCSRQLREGNNLINPRRCQVPETVEYCSIECYSLVDAEATKHIVQVCFVRVPHLLQCAVCVELPRAQRRRDSGCVGSNTGIEYIGQRSCRVGADDAGWLILRLTERQRSCAGGFANAAFPRNQPERGRKLE